MASPIASFIAISMLSFCVYCFFATPSLGEVSAKLDATNQKLHVIKQELDIMKQELNETKRRQDVIEQEPAANQEMLKAILQYLKKTNNVTIEDLEKYKSKKQTVSIKIATRVASNSVKPGFEFGTDDFFENSVAQLMIRLSQF